MYKLYGKTKSEIQKAGCQAQKTLSDIELSLQMVTESLNRVRKKGTNAYGYTINAIVKIPQLEKEIDNLMSISLTLEALMSKYYDEVDYLENLSEHPE